MRNLKHTTRIETGQLRGVAGPGADGGGWGKGGGGFWATWGLGEVGGKDGVSMSAELQVWHVADGVGKGDGVTGVGGVARVRAPCIGGE